MPSDLVLDLGLDPPGALRQQRAGRIRHPVSLQVTVGWGEVSCFIERDGGFGVCG